MKFCPNCKSEVDDNFDLCWNCQYSFADDKVLENGDYLLLCPACSAEIKTSSEYCPYCQFDFRKINKDAGIKPHGAKQIDCLRCRTPLDFQGQFRFHDETRAGTIGKLLNESTYKESFDFYCCPNCGKVEFFLPGFD